MNEERQNYYGSLCAKMYEILHEKRWRESAVAMFYPGVKERIAELYGDSYYVVFTSIHEARTHCRGAFSPRHMLRSLKETNQAFPTEEMLSEKVFYYDRDKRSFEALML